MAKLLISVAFSCLILLSIINISSSFRYIGPFNAYPAHYRKLKCYKFPMSETRGRYTHKLKMSAIDDNPYFKDLDAYQILEIDRSASKKDVKSAYRKLVSKWHPDKFPNDPVMQREGGLRMEKINRAYFCLEDEDRRRRYDTYGERGVGTSAASEEQLSKMGGPDAGFGGMGGGGSVVDINDISDVFDAFFGGNMGGMGGRGRRQRNPNAPMRGDDMEVQVDIPFMTAVFGGQERVRVRRLEECGVCSGSGMRPGAKARGCSVCGGQGMVNNVQRTPFGVFSNVQPCPNCRGSGEEVEDYCSSCRGKGSLSETKEVLLKIPAGADESSKLRVKDQGNAGMRGGPRGDLYVNVKIKKDEKFRREGFDIFSEEEISYTDAILGTTIKAETVDGKMDVKIPSGIQPAQMVRLKGRGVPKASNDSRGDAYITIKVTIPTNVSGKEKELVEQIADLLGKKASTSTGGFFSGFGSSS